MWQPHAERSTLVGFHQRPGAWQARRSSQTPLHVRTSGLEVINSDTVTVCDCHLKPQLKYFLDDFLEL